MPWDQPKPIEGLPPAGDPRSLIPPSWARGPIGRAISIGKQLLTPSDTAGPTGVELPRSLGRGPSGPTPQTPPQPGVDSAWPTRIPQGWRRFRDGSVGPPNPPSPIDQGWPTRVPPDADAPSDDERPGFQGGGFNNSAGVMGQMPLAGATGYTPQGMGVSGFDSQGAGMGEGAGGGFGALFDGGSKSAREGFADGGTLHKAPPYYLTRDNAIANLKLGMMPPPGYSEWGGGEAAGEPDKNIPGGNVGGSHDYQRSWTSDYNNAARPLAPPPYLSPNAPITPRGTANTVDLDKFHSPQSRAGYGEDGTRFDPSVNPHGFITGDQYRAIPPSIPPDVRAYIGDNPTTDLARGGRAGFASGGLSGLGMDPSSPSGIDPALAALLQISSSDPFKNLQQPQLPMGKGPPEPPQIKDQQQGKSPGDTGGGLGKSLGQIMGAFHPTLGPGQTGQGLANQYAEPPAGLSPDLSDYGANVDMNPADFGNFAARGGVVRPRFGYGGRPGFWGGGDGDGDGGGSGANASANNGNSSGAEGVTSSVGIGNNTSVNTTNHGNTSTVTGGENTTTGPNGIGISGFGIGPGGVAPAANTSGSSGGPGGSANSSTVTAAINSMMEGGHGAGGGGGAAASGGGGGGSSAASVMAAISSLFGISSAQAADLANNGSGYQGLSDQDRATFNKLAKTGFQAPQQFGDIDARGLGNNAPPSADDIAALKAKLAGPGGGGIGSDAVAGHTPAAPVPGDPGYNVFNPGGIAAPNSLAGPHGVVGPGGPGPSGITGVVANPGGGGGGGVAAPPSVHTLGPPGIGGNPPAPGPGLGGVAGADNVGGERLGGLGGGLSGGSGQYAGTQGQEEHARYRGGRTSFGLGGITRPGFLEGGDAPAVPDPVPVVPPSADTFGRSNTSLKVPTFDPNDTEDKHMPGPNAAPAPSPAPSTAASGDGGLGALKASVAKVESGGNYGAIGPTTKGDRPYGKYQVMGTNIGPWTQEVLGKAMTPEQFRSDPDAQEKVADAKLGGYLNQYGNPQDAASMWFTGRPYAKASAAGLHDVNMSVDKYVGATAPGGQPSGGGSTLAYSGDGGGAPPQQNGQQQQIQTQAAMDDAGRPPDRKLLPPGVGDALMAAGFAMMAGKSTNAMVNIGAGALEGMKYYQNQKQLDRAWQKDEAQIQDWGSQARNRDASTNLEVQKFNYEKNQATNAVNRQNWIDGGMVGPAPKMLGPNDSTVSAPASAPTPAPSKTTSPAPAPIAIAAPIAAPIATPAPAPSGGKAPIPITPGALIGKKPVAGAPPVVAGPLQLPRLLWRPQMGRSRPSRPQTTLPPPHPRRLGSPPRTATSGRACRTNRTRTGYRKLVRAT